MKKEYYIFGIYQKDINDLRSAYKDDLKQKFESLFYNNIRNKKILRAPSDILKNLNETCEYLEKLLLFQDIKRNEFNRTEIAKEIMETDDLINLCFSKLSSRFIKKFKSNLSEEFYKTLRNLSAKYWLLKERCKLGLSHYI